MLLYILNPKGFKNPIITHMSSHSHIYTLSQKQTKPITATDIATVIAKDMATVIDKDMASDSHRHGYLQPPT